MSRGSQRLKTAVILAVVTTLAAGCTDEDVPSATPTQDAGPTATDAAAGIIEARKIVEEFRQPPKWQGPEAPVPIGSVSGRKVTYVSVSNSIPVLKYWSDAVTRVLQQYGNVTVNVIDAKGSVDEANKGFEQAIAQKADVIVTQGLPVQLFQAQITRAKAAGIKVVSGNTGVPGKLDAGQDADVSFDYVKAGRLIGDWVVADSNGAAKGLVISSDDVPASQPQAQGTIGEVKRLCSACDMTMKDVQIPQWQTSIPRGTAPPTTGPGFRGCGRSNSGHGLGASAWRIVSACSTVRSGSASGELSRRSQFKS
jgi:ABC-type sugar transport system substrate-binding protein